MCGITGFWSFNNKTIDLSTIALKMADSIKERGPDSSGIWIDPNYNLAFAHRRLAVVDLSPAGHQPMVSRSGRLIITYNGEIFNTEELRLELINNFQLSNDFFHGSSDTEVILHGCEMWGVEATVKKLIGMFAFAVWDREQKKLYLVRDRMGIKPLYWGWANNVLFFGSQIKSFIPHPDWHPTVNQQALALYLQYGYVPEPHSIFQGIKKLTAGTIIAINQHQQANQTVYWDLSQVITTQPKQLLSDEEWIENCHDLLVDAISRRTIADVPLGAFLSGGIDSSLVVSIMQANSKQKIKTFSIGFTEDQYNEAPYAKKVAEHLGTDHHEEYLSSKQAQAIIPEIPAWCDEPFADSSQIPTLLVSKIARQQVTVCLSGDGGDELFAGYNRYLMTNKLWGYLKILPLPLRNIISKIIQLPPTNWWDHIHKIAPQKIPACLGHKLYKIAKILTTASSDDFFHHLITCWDDVNAILPNSLAAGTILPAAPSILSDLGRMQYYDQLTYLPGDILTKVDRASMWVSLEARVPLLDHRLVSFAWGMPENLKIRNGQTKWILRQILQKYLPKSLFERPKMGFGVPIDQWLRSDLRDWGEGLLQPSVLESCGLNSKIIRQCWQQHLDGKRNWQSQIWNILMLQQWRKFYNFYS